MTASACKGRTRSPGQRRERSTPHPKRRDEGSGNSLVYKVDLLKVRWKIALGSFGNLVWNVPGLSTHLLVGFFLSEDVLPKAEVGISASRPERGHLTSSVPKIRGRLWLVLLGLILPLVAWEGMLGYALIGSLL